MSKRRFAPLINLLYGAVAIGEGIGRYAVGDIKGSAESFFAAVSNVLLGIFPYGCDDDEINVYSGISNAFYATIILLHNNYHPKDSLTLKFFPFIAVYQELANVIEIYKNKKIK